MKLGAIVLDSNDSEGLSDFYQKLLNWNKTIRYLEGEKVIIVSSDNGEGMPLVFQEVTDYQRPVWPSEPEKQQSMIHLAFYADFNEFNNEMLQALNHGAKLSDVQMSDDWNVFFDPAGHPFCIIPIPPK